MKLAYFSLLFVLVLILHSTRPLKNKQQAQNFGKDHYRNVTLGSRDGAQYITEHEGIIRETTKKHRKYILIDTHLGGIMHGISPH